MAREETRSHDLDRTITRVMSQTERLRCQRADDALDRLTPYELWLVGEAAVMGWVLGFRQHAAGATEVGDFPKLPPVVDGCLTFPDLYPMFAAAAAGLRPEDEGFTEFVLRKTGRWPEDEEGED